MNPFDCRLWLKIAKFSDISDVLNLRSVCTHSRLEDILDWSEGNQHMLLRLVLKVPEKLVLGHWNFFRSIDLPSLFRAICYAPKTRWNKLASKMYNDAGGSCAMSYGFYSGMNAKSICVQFLQPPAIYIDSDMDVFLTLRFHYCESASALFSAL